MQQLGDSRKHQQLLLVKIMTSKGSPPSLSSRMMKSWENQWKTLHFPAPWLGGSRGQIQRG